MFSQKNMSFFSEAKRLLVGNKTKLEVVDKEYSIGVIKIRLPFDHALPTYQSRYPLYDKFLPFVVASLGDEGIIVDVGANVGDTAILLAQHCSNKIVSIEPDNTFYTYLVSNVRDAGLSDRIFTANYAIGDEGGSIALTRCNGTATPVIDETNNSIKLTSLREVLAKANLNDARIRLLKCDTDGFDYQILFGSLDLIDASKPLLYWENTVENIGDLDDSNQLINKLSGVGYSAFACFDNFGSLLYTGNDARVLKQLNGYLLFQRQVNQVVVYYFDFLAWVDADAEIAEACIEKYRQFSLLKN